MNSLYHATSSNFLKNRIVYFFAVLLVLFLGVVFFFFLRSLKPDLGKKEASELIRPLFCTFVQKTEIKPSLCGFGTIEPTRLISISSEVKGQIIDGVLDLKPGKIFKKGDLIYQIDNRDYQIAIDQSHAEIEQLKAEIDLTKETLQSSERELKEIQQDYQVEQSRYKRNQDLAKAGALSQDLLDTSNQQVMTKSRQLLIAESALTQIRFRIRSYEAQLKKVQYILDQAQLNNERCFIKAPFNGRITQVFAESYEWVSVGQPLFEIADDSKLRVLIPLHSELLKKRLNCAINDQYHNWICLSSEASTEVQIGDSIYPGKIERIENFEKKTGTFQVSVEILANNNQNQITDGSFCKVVFMGNQKKNLFKLPITALQLDYCLYVVDKDKRLQSRECSIFAMDEDFILVDHGIQEGDLVVIQKMARDLVNGSLIRPVFEEGDCPQGKK